ncbi:MAG: cbb3-type cytochrome c oxidase subunit 3 [Hyphomicrobium sp.]|jgi:cbb3-type cytochrome oxidase subunit 3|nr:cbb3-type cytochrome c oxidase subunit 3 [Hyphomicrobium sp.]
MTYETVAAVSQTVSLLLFIAIFLIVLGYVFWPSNRKRLEHAQRQALDLDKSSAGPGNRSVD